MAQDRWLLVRSEGTDAVEVRRNDRAHSTHPDLDAAQSAVDRAAAPGDRIMVQDPDGYRSKVAPRRRRGWRQPHASR